MKRYIQSAEYKRYNANNRGTYTGDCVKRALSMAFGIDYIQVARELNAIGKANRGKAFNDPIVFEKYIEQHGGGRLIVPQDNTLTLAETVDNIASTGTYIFETNNKPTFPGHGNHLTCSIDGQIFDSWDSRDQYVTNYWKIDNRDTLELTDITDHIVELIDYSMICIKTEFDKYIKKLQIGDIVGYARGNVRSNGDYGFTVPMYLYLYDDASKKDKDTFIFKLAYVFTPSTSVEAAKKKIAEVTKVRIYDRFYSLKKTINDREEANKLYQEAGYEKQEIPWMDNRETRFFNSLPGWCKPFIEMVYIQNPGQYVDSYTVRMKPLKGDHRPNQKVEFYGYDSAMVKDQIDMYRKDFSRPGTDYPVSEMW